MKKKCCRKCYYEGKGNLFFCFKFDWKKKQKFYLHNLVFEKSPKHFSSDNRMTIKKMTFDSETRRYKEKDVLDLQNNRPFFVGNFLFQKCVVKYHGSVFIAKNFCLVKYFAMLSKLRHQVAGFFCIFIDLKNESTFDTPFSLHLWKLFFIPPPIFYYRKVREIWYLKYFSKRGQKGYFSFDFELCKTRQATFLEMPHQ